MRRIGDRSLRYTYRGKPKRIPLATFTPVKGRGFILKEVQKEQTYESAIERLEEIVSLLEGGSLPLEDALRLLEEGTRLAG